MASTDVQSGGVSGVVSEASPLLRLRGVTKWFPGVQALDRVDFDLRPGEVHVLFGENGAGKSTLINIVAGALRPNAGDILLRGTPVQFRSVYDARQRGISAVFQEFSLVPDMTVEENLFLGAELTTGVFLNKPELHRRAEATLSRLGFHLRPRTKVNRLSRAEQQMVEIAKAFRTNPAILILDEPTAALTQRETERLFQLIEEVKRQGVGVVYITHRMNEVHRIGDRITVLRDGYRVATLDVQDATPEKLVELMTGRKIEAFFPRIAHRPEGELLAVESLSAGDSVRGRDRRAGGAHRVREVRGRPCMLRPRVDHRGNDPLPRPTGDPADAPRDARGGACLSSARPPRGGARGRTQCPREHRPRRAPHGGVQRAPVSQATERARHLC